MKIMKHLIFILFLLQALGAKGQMVAAMDVAAISTTKVECNGKSINDGKALLFTSHTTSKGKPASTTVRKATAVGEDDMVLKSVFNLTVPSGDNYYFQAGVSSIYVKDKQFQQISVFVNGKYQGVLDCGTDGWEMVGIKGNPCISLNGGDNVVEFISACPFYPEVSAIQISKTQQGLAASFETPSSLQTASLADSSMPQVQASSAKWQTTPKEIVLDSVSMKTAWQDVPVTFTYHRKIAVTNAGKITIHTAPVDGEDYYMVDPYMYFYSIDNPSKYSWSNDNSTGNHPKLEMNVPVGDYYLVICAKSNKFASQLVPRAGFVKVYYNGAVLTEQATVGGYMINAPIQDKTVLNYFTSKTNAWVRLFLIDGDKMMFNTEPNTYYSPADYIWDYGARQKIQTNKKRPNWKVLVTAREAVSAVWGSCDVYCGLKDAPSKYLTKFPNLKAGDAILLGEESAKYNSAAWACGITNKKIWIGNSSYGSPYEWESWDDYFANAPLRYPGAKSLSRTGRGNLAVIMYSKDGTMAGVSHFAVTNHANNRLHGFAYDSKIGTWGRITHEYNSLNGTEYGKPYAFYYEDISTRANANEEMSENAPAVYTFENSIEDGLTVEGNVLLDTEEEIAIQNRLGKDDTSMLTLKKMFAEWGKVVNSDDGLQENFYAFLENEQGNALVAYGKQHLEESVALFGSLLFDENVSSELASDKELLSVLFCKIVVDKYAEVLEKIKEEWNKNPYTEGGAYIYPSCEYFTKQYIRKIIRKEFNVPSEMNEELVEKDIPNDSHLFHLTDNPVRENGTDVVLHVPQGKTFSVRIVDATTGAQTNVVSNSMASQESYVFHVDAADVPCGLSVCVLEMDGKVYSRKMVKK